MPIYIYLNNKKWYSLLIQTVSFIYKLIGGTQMARSVDIKDMLEKIVAFNHEFSKLKKNILDMQKINASAINLISIIGDDRMTLKEITEISELDKSTISRQMNVLVNQGLVIREIGEDKRYSFFELSDKAKNIFQQYTQDFVQYIENALIGWSEEEKQMFSVLIGRANYSLSPSSSDKNKKYEV